MSIAVKSNTFDHLSSLLIHFLQSEGNSSDYLKGFWREYELTYLHESLGGERNIPDFWKRDRIEMALEIHPKCRYAIKIHNFRRALHRVMDSKDFPLTPDFICSLHAIAMEGLILDPGKFRTCEVRPVGSPEGYVRSDQITERLQKLCSMVQSTTIVSMNSAVRLGTELYSVFLTIHPFVNGNGRVARLLLSHFFLKFIPIPIMLENTRNGRENYIMLLEESRVDSSALANFIGQSVLHSLHEACFMLEL